MDRFEFVCKQDILGEKVNIGSQYECNELLLTAVVLRDKHTGVMYLWGKQTLVDLLRCWIKMENR